MSRIKQGQTFGGKIADILNTHFTARTAQGKPLANWYKSVWPYGTPFLVNKHDVRRENAIVWFPFVTSAPNSQGIGDWINVVSNDRHVITTKYVGKDSFQDVCGRVSRFIGKNHIVFARWEGQNRPFEFLGVYTSEWQGDTFVYKRFAEFIETSAWTR